ncbi:putative uncharacterized protein DDB_G0282499 [Condylostylus longicornis]|uniref:putative uncharacterized protein DDB_G0282499 n=1 Tax=Condylostylus longicornis TaxID=2530218 RepID=UPI00244E43D6|nr:putative uncharacterized protein DDB_G0282499 [Condylostylus longicornis]
MVNDLNIKDYYIKTITLGIKIYCLSNESFKKTCDFLQSNNSEFFLHDLKSEKPFKAVIHGLDKTDVCELKQTLINIGLKCIEVKEITKKSKINVKNTKKPTQCYNCQMFGHGEKHCNVKTFCAFCSQNHKSNECPNKSSPQCANCKGAHYSTDTTCPSRSAYINILSKNKKNQNASTSRYQNKNVNMTTNYNANFPSIIKNSQQQQNAPQRQHTSTWSNVNFINNNNLSNTNNNISGITSNTNTNNNLFSAQEINNLTNELLSKLSKCINKTEQFFVITDLVAKYLYGP